MSDCDVTNASGLLLLRDNSALVSFEETLDIVDPCADLDIGPLAENGQPNYDGQDEPLVEQLGRLLVQKDQEIEELRDRAILIERRTSQQLADLTMKWTQRRSAIAQKIKLTLAQLQAAVNDNELLAGENHDLKLQTGKLVRSLSDSERSNSQLREDLRVAQEAVLGLKSSLAQQVICLEDQQERLELYTDPLLLSKSTHNNKRCCCSKIRAATKGLPDATILNLVERYANIQLCDAAIQTEPEFIEPTELQLDVDAKTYSDPSATLTQRKFGITTTESISIVSDPAVQLTHPFNGWSQTQAVSIGREPTASATNNWTQTDDIFSDGGLKATDGDSGNELRDEEGISTTASSSSIGTPTEKSRHKRLLNRSGRVHRRGGSTESPVVAPVPEVSGQIYIVGNKKVVIPPIGPDDEYHHRPGSLRLPPPKSLVDELEAELLGCTVEHGNSCMETLPREQKIVVRRSRACRNRKVRADRDYERERPKKLPKKGTK